MVLVYKIFKKIKKKAACKIFVTPITYGLNKEHSFEDLPRTTLFLKSLLKFSAMHIASIRRSQVQWNTPWSSDLGKLEDCDKFEARLFYKADSRLTLANLNGLHSDPSSPPLNLNCSKWKWPYLLNWNILGKVISCTSYMVPSTFNELFQT